MKHLGNICQINGEGIAPVDVVIGGSPVKTYQSPESVKVCPAKGLVYLWSRFV